MNNISKTIRKFGKPVIKTQKELIMQPKTDLINQLKQFTEIAFSDKSDPLPKAADNIVNIESITPRMAYHLINTDFEIFFKTREINVKNLNFLISVAGEQRQFHTLLQTFEKIKLLGMNVNPLTYYAMITALAKCHKTELTEKFIQEAFEKTPKIPVLYCCVIYAYNKLRLFDQAKNLWTRAIEIEGIKPDLPMVTSIISTHLLSHDIKKCWTIFENCEKYEVVPDDVLLGLMIKICAKSHSSEKAKLLFEKMKGLPNIRFNCEHYNAIMLALSSRKEYAQEAIDYWHKMKDLNIQPNRLTFFAVLNATSKTGDINEAYNAIVQMNALKIKHNDQIYDGLLRTYASAISYPNIPKELKELYLKDSWEIFRKMEAENPKHIKVNVLNSLVLVHINANKIQEAEDLILSLYDKYSIQKNGDTFHHFIQCYFDDRNFPKIKVIFDNLLIESKSLIKTESLDVFLDSFIRIRDVERMNQVFDLFLERKKEPSRPLIKYLADVRNLPDVIYDKLRKFPFGELILKDKLRTYFVETEFEKHTKPRQKDRGTFQRKDNRK